MANSSAEQRHQDLQLARGHGSQPVHTALDLCAEYLGDGGVELRAAQRRSAASACSMLTALL
jgi:hypothetical protein